MRVEIKAEGDFDDDAMTYNLVSIAGRRGEKRDAYRE